MLTKRQLKVLNFLEAYQRAEGGVSPSVIEIAEHLGVNSKSNAVEVLAALEERGFIRRLPHRCRAIEILKLAPGGRGPTPPPNRIPVYDAETLQLREYLP